MAQSRILALLSLSFFFLLMLGCAQQQPPPPVFEEPQNTSPPPQQAVNGTAGANESSNITNDTGFGTEAGSVAIITDQPNETLNETPDSTLNETNASALNETIIAGPLVLNNTRLASSEKIGEGTFGIEYQPDSPLDIYFIDVGFGDSILVKKGSFAMLVDGGDYDHGDAVASFISTHNISRLQAVVATYPAAEHIGGLPSVLQSIPTDEFWDNHVRSTSSEYTALYAETYDKGMPVKWPAAGDSLSVNNMSIDILNPQLNRFGTNPQTDAIAMVLTYNKFCAVLLSDVPEEIDPLMVERGGSKIRCDVVKLTNHGSGRPEPSMLVSRIAPKAAVISVGANSEGLPNPTTITRMQLAKIVLYRTDQNGTISVTSNGTSFTMNGTK